MPGLQGRVPQTRVTHRERPFLNEQGTGGAPARKAIR